MQRVGAGRGGEGVSGLGRPVAEPPRRSLGANQRPRHRTAARAHAQRNPPPNTTPPSPPCPPPRPGGADGNGDVPSPRQTPVWSSGSPARQVRTARSSALCVGPPLAAERGAKNSTNPGGGFHLKRAGFQRR